MIVLDTNVLSEAMKPESHPVVRAWLDEQAAETLYRCGSVPGSRPQGHQPVGTRTLKELLLNKNSIENGVVSRTMAFG